MPRKKRIQTIEIPCSLFKRFTAFLIDILILEIVVFGSLTKIAEKLIPKDVSFSNIIGSNAQLSSAITTISVYIFLIYLVYFTWLEFKFGQTIGKIMMGIFVKSETKENLTLLRVLISNAIFLPLMPFILFFWILDLGYLIFTNKRLLEKWAKIKLVQEVQI